MSDVLYRHIFAYTMITIIDILLNNRKIMKKMSEKWES